jgi:hypothetical protein
MKDTDATVMAVTFAKTIARIAEFAVDLAESLHKDLGLEYSGPASKGKQASKKRSRAERDPNEPKKPPTGYMIYSSHVRAEAKKRGEALPQLKEIADMWAKLDEKEKERFNGEAQQQKDVYDRQMAEYKSGVSNHVSKSEEESSSESEDADDVAPPAKLMH